jgi:UrcA family protein
MLTTRRGGSPYRDFAVRPVALLAPQTLFSNLETNMPKMIPTAVALAVTLTFASAAHAETSRIVVKQLALPYRTAELTTAPGAARLLSRVDGVALRMCRGNPTSAFDHPIRAQIEACRAKAVARAVTELDAPLVSAAYIERQGAQLAAR